MNIVIPQASLPILSKAIPSSSSKAASAVAKAARFPVNRIYCIGRNYREHAIEMGHDPDREPPFFFQKPADAVVDASSKSCIIPYPPMTSSLHFEAELVLAIGKGGIRIKEEDAKDHIFGYAIGCDLTRRDLQSEAKKLKRPWATAKGFDNSAPIGNIVPKDEINFIHDTNNNNDDDDDSSCILLPPNSNITLSVNGELKQDSTIDKMVWKIPEMISYLSNYFQLKPGDLIMTGTPAGVDAVHVGDYVEISCGGLPKCIFTMGEPE